MTMDLVGSIPLVAAAPPIVADVATVTSHFVRAQRMDADGDRQSHDGLGLGGLTLDSFAPNKSTVYVFY
jgi:hypothetical protein